MKFNIKIYIVGLSVFASLLTLSSCNKFLDRAPLDQVTPEAYLKTEQDLAAYSIKAYNFSTHDGYGMGTFVNDYHTDNVAYGNASYDRWVPGNLRVPNTSGTYSFVAIRNINYFLNRVVVDQEAGAISGNEANINHYIGEMYLLRAWEYFIKVKAYGDFPIVTETLVDDKEILIAKSERKPRTEVVRFMLEDLDKALGLLQESFKSKNRLTRNVALMIKSRIALNEASWLTYHRNTPFVPGAEGWPGSTADYNQGFAIDLDAEIKFLLDQSISASKELADKITLTPNTYVSNPQTSGSHSGWNPYFEMFGAVDMSSYSEVLFWRAYDVSLSIAHHTPLFIRFGSNNGLTKGAVDSYLMQNGLPIYAGGSGYKGDINLDVVKEDRDNRLQLFVFGHSDALTNYDENEKFEVPGVINNDTEAKDVTGYRNRKYYNYEPIQSESGSGGAPVATTGSIVFRGVEAHLNYMEAIYMRDGSLDGTAISYWKSIRNRAGVSEDFNATIAATDLSKENDWATYSAGQLVDATLYNIRRERRLELLGESVRMDDLKRWRALDQVKNYIVEGANFWSGMHENDFYKVDGVTVLIEPGGDKDANISGRSDSKYLRPYRIIEANNQVYNGYTWSKANYLTPLPAYEILLTANAVSAGEVVDLGTSPLYQNPYWPSKANLPATE